MKIVYCVNNVKITKIYKNQNVLNMDINTLCYVMQAKKSVNTYSCRFQCINLIDYPIDEC